MEGEELMKCCDEKKKKKMMMMMRQAVKRSWKETKPSGMLGEVKSMHEH